MRQDTKAHEESIHPGLHQPYRCSQCKNAGFPKKLSDFRFASDYSKCWHARGTDGGLTSTSMMISAPATRMDGFEKAGGRATISHPFRFATPGAFVLSTSQVSIARLHNPGFYRYRAPPGVLSPHHSQNWRDSYLTLAQARWIRGSFANPRLTETDPSTSTIILSSLSMILTHRLPTSLKIQLLPPITLANILSRNIFPFDNPFVTFGSVSSSYFRTRSVPFALSFPAVYSRLCQCIIRFSLLAMSWARHRLPSSQSVSFLTAEQTPLAHLVVLKWSRRPILTTTLTKSTNWRNPPILLLILLVPIPAYPWLEVVDALNIGSPPPGTTPLGNLSWPSKTLSGISLNPSSYVLSPFTISSPPSVHC